MPSRLPVVSGLLGCHQVSTLQHCQKREPLNRLGRQRTHTWYSSHIKVLFKPHARVELSRQISVQRRLESLPPQRNGADEQLVEAVRSRQVPQRGACALIKRACCTQTTQLVCELRCITYSYYLCIYVLSCWRTDHLGAIQDTSSRDSTAGNMISISILIRDR